MMTHLDRQAYLLAEFRFLPSGTHMLYQFCVRSENHKSITTDFRRGFYATVLEAHGASYSDAVRHLRKTVRQMLPALDRLISW